ERRGAAGETEPTKKRRFFSAAIWRESGFPAGAPETLSVHPNEPVKTLGDLIASARQKPFDYASPGVGTSSHVAAAYFFKELAKIEPVQVPFQGGAPAVNAVMGGHVRVLIGTPPGFAGQFPSHDIRGRSLSSDKRAPDCVQ